MADSMYNQVKEAIKKQIVVAQFFALTCDEVTMIDNDSWICVHTYVVQNFVRVLYLISLQCLVDGGSVDSLTLVIMNTLESGGDVTKDQIARRLLSFGADGVNTFQAARTDVTTQI